MTSGQEMDWAYSTQIPVPLTYEKLDKTAFKPRSYQWFIATATAED